jgi:hypothetical protein
LTKQQTHPFSCTLVARKTTKNNETKQKPKTTTKENPKTFFDSSKFPNLLNNKTKVFFNIPCQEDNKKQATQNKKTTREKPETLCIGC